MEIIVDIFNIVTAAVALASAVAAVTPTPKDDEWVAKAYKFCLLYTSPSPRD